MKIIRIKDLSNKQEISKIWNNEYGKIYPISDELWLRNLNNANLDNSYVALTDKIVGFIITKVYEDDYPINGYQETGWISLIYVIPQERNKGIGTLLLEKAENDFIRLNKHHIYIGKDMNDFFPGIPIDLKHSTEWFEKRGYQRLYSTCDLIIHKNNKMIPLKNDKIIYQLGSINFKDEIISFLENNWPGRWTKETIEYFENGGTGREYLLGIDGDKICAFAKVCFPDTPTILISNSMTWRDRFEALGGIGPLGVEINHRHKSIGYDIVACATNLLFESNASDIIIDWTNLLDFYRKLGYEVWKSYEYVKKEI